MAAILFASFANAQGDIEFTTNDGATISNNQVFTFNTPYSTDNESAKMLLHVKNTSETETLRFMVKVLEITNNSWGVEAEEVQLCFSTLCYNSIEANHIYPNNPVTLAPGDSNHPDDHFLNSNLGTNGTGVTYKFKFVEVDAEENELGDLLTFTYQYAPTASVSDFTNLSNMGVNVKNTVIKNQLEVDASVNATLQVFNINGQIVKTVALNSGSQFIDLSNLTTAVYIARFTTSTNQSSEIRIVKN